MFLTGIKGNRIFVPVETFIMTLFIIFLGELLLGRTNIRSHLIGGIYLVYKYHFLQFNTYRLMTRFDIGTVKYYANYSVKDNCNIFSSGNNIPWQINCNAMNYVHFKSGQQWSKPGSQRHNEPLLMCENLRFRWKKVALLIYMVLRFR